MSSSWFSRLMDNEEGDWHNELDAEMNQKAQLKRQRQLLCLWRAATALLRLLERVRRSQVRSRRIKLRALFRCSVRILQLRFTIQKARRRIAGLVFRWRLCACLVTACVRARRRAIAASQIQRHARGFLKRKQIAFIARTHRYDNAVRCLHGALRRYQARQEFMQCWKSVSLRELHALSAVLHAKQTLSQLQAEQSARTIQRAFRGMLGRREAQDRLSEKRAQASREVKAYLEALRSRLRFAEFRRSEGYHRAGRALWQTKSMNGLMSFGSRYNQLRPKTPPPTKKRLAANSQSRPAQQVEQAPQPPPKKAATPVFRRTACPPSPQDTKQQDQKAIAVAASQPGNQSQGPPLICRDHSNANNGIAKQRAHSTPYPNHPGQQQARPHMFAYKLTAAAPTVQNHGCNNQKSSVSHCNTPTLSNSSMPTSQTTTSSIKTRSNSQPNGLRATTGLAVKAATCRTSQIMRRQPVSPRPQVSPRQASPQSWLQQVTVSPRGPSESGSEMPLPRPKSHVKPQQKKLRSTSQPSMVAPGTSAVQGSSSQPTDGSIPVTPRSDVSWVRRSSSPRSLGGGVSGRSVGSRCRPANFEGIVGSTSEAAARSSRMQLRSWMARARQEASALYTSGALAGLKTYHNRSHNSSALEGTRAEAADHIVGRTLCQQEAAPMPTRQEQLTGPMQVAQQQQELQDLHEQYLEVQQLLGQSDLGSLIGSAGRAAPLGGGYKAITPLQLGGLRQPISSPPTLDSAREASTCGSGSSPPVSARFQSSACGDGSAGAASSLDVGSFCCAVPPPPPLAATEAGVPYTTQFRAPMMNPQRVPL
eukprot:TRINITY_DN33259_c0_g1_i1.p1 TRINITY_DN33259_c0_g1~~TRINITY_DN33259_c0_g1_i1.p1  ORF type:complete len:818 (+),score=99.61 TRINITY_DN33259_c0_g1_i1:24-2477(+)